MKKTDLLRAKRNWLRLEQSYMTNIPDYISRSLLQKEQQRFIIQLRSRLVDKLTKQIKKIKILTTKEVAL